ncbi:MAG: serine/threonine-protein kinase [Acidobacteriota bacterium]
MSNDADAHFFELLAEAADWPPSERRARALEACQGGPVRVDDLLDALERGDRAEAFLGRPAWEDATSLPAQQAENDGPSEPWQPGQTIGRYRLLESLGRGGMGEVFLAEQGAPERRVALKLIRSDGMSAHALRRFGVEQQTLARLSHPHIAQLFEADLTADGTPYFAMEWIDGRTIDAYLADRPANLEERLRLFLEVCAAVSHAHQKQIVHLDLKPSNVLIRDLDGKASVKVIDFGISEVLDRPAGVAGVSEGGGVNGTPEFMSPESFDGDVDTRSDVYALGLLLYEMVSGTRPFQHRGGELEALMERIRRGEISAPSQRVSGSRLNLAGAAEKKRWMGLIRGDLDAVIARAIKPSREERYASVADLAADLERYLNSRPVKVREAPLWHHMRLLARRRRGRVAAVTIAILGVLAGTIGTTFGLLRAREEAQTTRLALDEAQELSRFLTDLFQQSDPNRALGNELTARELLEQGRTRLESSDLADQPLTRARLSRTVGDIYANLGDYAAAEAMLQSALDLFRQELGENHSEIAQTLHGLASMKAFAGKNKEAASLYEQALHIQEKQEKSAAATDSSASDLARTLYHLGVLAFRASDFDRAENYFARACPIWRRVGTSQDRARCLDAFGVVYMQRSRLEEAEELFLESLRLREEALGTEHPHVAASLESLCTLARDRQQFEAAAGFCIRSLEIRRQVYGDEHSQVAWALQQLGTVQRHQRRWPEAEAATREALAIVRAQPETNLSMEIRLITRLGWIAWMSGDPAKSIEHYRAALSRSGDSLVPGEPGAPAALLGIGLSEWKLGRLDEAERHLLRVHDFFIEHHGPESATAAWTYWGLAGVSRDRADPDRDDLVRAGELYGQALAIRQRVHQEGHELRVLAEDDHAAYLEVLRLARSGTND